MALHLVDGHAADRQSHPEAAAALFDLLLEEAVGGQVAVLCDLTQDTGVHGHVLVVGVFTDPKEVVGLKAVRLVHLKVETDVGHGQLGLRCRANQFLID